MTDSLSLSDFGFNIVQIETKASCNMACQFCPYPLRKDKKSVLPAGVVHDLIEQINPRAERFEYVCFSYYNEPLMDDRLFDFIHHAKDKGLPTFLVTNALLLENQNFRKKLIDTAPNIIKVSLQTVSRKHFNNVRGVQIDITKYFDIIYAFLSEARNISSSINIDVACNFLNRKMYVLKWLLGLSVGDPSVPMSVRSLKHDIISFLGGLVRYDSYFDFNIDELSEFLKDTSPKYILEEGFTLARNIRLKIKPFIYGRRIHDFQSAIHPFACSNRMVSVMANGDVVPCCLAYDNKISIGNIKEQKLSEILYQNKTFLKILRSRNYKKPETCKKCLGEPTKRGLGARWLIDKIRTQ